MCRRGGHRLSEDKKELKGSKALQWHGGSVVQARVRSRLFAGSVGKYRMNAFALQVAGRLQGMVQW